MFEKLMDAINKNNPAVAEEIVAKITSEVVDSYKGADWLSALSMAATKGQDIVFHKLFAKVSQQVISAKDESNKTVLHVAAAKGYDKIVAEITNISPKLAEAFDNGKLTPLHYQAKAEKANPKVVELLLSKMSNKAIDATDNQGKTALHYHGQIANTDIKVIKLLLSKMSRKAVDVADNQGETVLHHLLKHTTSENIGEIVELILGKASDETINVVSSHDKTTALNHLLNNSNIKESIDHPITKTFLVKMNQEAIGSTIASIKSIQHTNDGQIAVYKNAINTNPQTSVHYSPHINNLTRQNNELNKRFDQLITCCDELIEENPKDAELYLKKSNILFATDNQAEGKKCYEEGQKIKASGGHISTVISNIAEIEEAGVINSTDEEQAYSASKIKKLIKMQLQTATVSIIAADVEKGKLSANEIQQLLKLVKEEGKIVVPLHLHGSAWAGIIISKDGEYGLKIIYNDPGGKGYATVKGAKSLINALMSSTQKIEKIDLCHPQNESDTDSSVFVVDNLVTLIKKGVTDLEHEALKMLLPMSEEKLVYKMRMKHSLIVNNDPWYGKYKLCKLLEIKLRDENVLITAIDLETNEEVAGKIKKALKSIVKHDSVVVPLHLHDKDWAGLVIKKYFEDDFEEKKEGKEKYNGLKILYNNPKGVPLNSEKVVKKLISKISEKVGEIKVFDVLKKQPDTDTQPANDNDSGVFTVENLFVLSTNDTDSLGRGALRNLLEENINNDPSTIRKEHIELLSQEVGVPLYEYMELAGVEAQSGENT